MKVVYKKRTSYLIREAIEQATKDCAKIDYIVLTSAELEDLKDENSGSLVCARVVEKGDSRYRMFAGVKIFLEGEKHE